MLLVVNKSISKLICLEKVEKSVSKERSFWYDNWVEDKAGPLMKVYVAIFNIFEEPEWTLSTADSVTVRIVIVDLP